MSVRYRLGRLRRYRDHMSGQPPNYAGMTVNERLFEAGLLKEFDSAIASGDRRRAIEILGHVAMTEDGATRTVDTVLRNPSKYGYPRPT
jgi:hypothetical protein